MSETKTKKSQLHSGDACACVHFDRFVCANMRYQRMDRFPLGEEFDPCDCRCHDEYDDEEDDGLCYP